LEPYEPLGPLDRQAISVVAAQQFQWLGGGSEGALVGNGRRRPRALRGQRLRNRGCALKRDQCPRARATEPPSMMEFPKSQVSGFASPPAPPQIAARANHELQTPVWRIGSSPFAVGKVKRHTKPDGA
jgi:hypothetical protein